MNLRTNIINECISMLKDCLCALGLLVIIGCNSSKSNVTTDFRQWAETPPMGWNSWDCFGPSVVESEVKANADYMATHLKEFGWEYIVVDIRWYVDNQSTGHYNSYEKSDFILDEFGRYLPSPKRFPSSANGKGFKELADYIHNRGLKFGIHIMRGVPKEAVHKKLLVKNTKITADKIYSPEYQCSWLPDNYTVLKNKEGAQEYYNSILELYASWGVDYIKVDDLSRPYHKDEIEMLRNAIDKTGRPIVLSMSPGATPLEEHEHAANNSNLWRTVDDFWDNWSQLNYAFDKCAEWAPHIAKGSWPDADMLPLGHLSIRGERGEDRFTNFTRDEQYTLMTLWSIFKSPLMFGGHLPDNDDFTNSIITNREVLDMHRNSINNRERYRDKNIIYWTANDSKTGDLYVAIFNNEGDGFINTDQLIYRSGTVSKLTDGRGKLIDIKLPKDSKELYLIVNDNGDGYSCDHANWINPTIELNDGTKINLLNKTWDFATTGWGTIQKNKSISGRDLIVNNTTYDNGIGTHSQSIIKYTLPENTLKFTAFAALDKQGLTEGCGSTVEFMIANKDPRVDKKSIKSEKVTLDLKKFGLEGSYQIRDLWRKKDMGTFSNSEFSTIIPQHGALLYKIYKS